MKLTIYTHETQEGLLSDRLEATLNAVLRDCNSEHKVEFLKAPSSLIAEVISCPAVDDPMVIVIKFFGPAVGQSGLLIATDNLSPLKDWALRECGTAEWGGAKKADGDIEAVAT